MSRTSFDRDDRVWIYPLQTGSEALLADEHFIERDTLLESELLETSLEDYDDVLSMARDDYDYLEQ